MKPFEVGELDMALRVADDLVQRARQADFENKPGEWQERHVECRDLLERMTATVRELVRNRKR